MEALAERPVDSPARAALRGKTFRCFAYKAGNDVFIAECIDLNIVVQAKTIKKAASNLRSAIDGYLEVATEGESLEGLVPRPSPQSHRHRYLWVGLQIKAALTIHAHLHQKTLDRRTFDCPALCPAT